jgi:hypothetical protein
LNYIIEHGLETLPAGTTVEQPPDGRIFFCLPDKRVFMNPSRGYKQSPIPVDGHLRYIVTGTGHCGTTYARHLIGSVVGTVWEHAFRHELDESRIGDAPVEVSGMAAAWLTHPATNGAAVIHLTRHPLQVWRSMVYKAANVPRVYLQRGWPESVLRMKLPGGLREYVTAFIVVWNKMIEASGRVRERVDLKALPQWVESEFGDTPEDPGVIRPHAAKRAPVVKWEDLPKCEWTDRLYSQTREYGYE